jgi:hypothetical protein
MSTAADRLPDFTIVATPAEGMDHWIDPPAGLAAVRPVLAVDRRGCFRYCSAQVLVAAEAVAFLPVMAEGATAAQRKAAIAYLRGAFDEYHPGCDGIDYSCAADRVVAERHPKTGDVLTFRDGYTALLNRWRPYGARPSWPAVRRWGRGPRVYARLLKLAAAV